MGQVVARRGTALVGLLGLLLGALVVLAPASHAEESDADEPGKHALDYVEVVKTIRGAHVDGELRLPPSGTSGIRDGFLQAKKAFHRARQEIQAIKKGEECPVSDVPTFFDSEEEDSEDEVEEGDGHLATDESGSGSACAENG